MATSTSQLRYHIISTFWIALLGFPTGLIFCESCRSDFSKFITIGIYSAILWIVLWKGNEALSLWLDLKFDWVNTPLKRLTAGIGGHIIFTVLAILFINFTIFRFMGWDQEISSLGGIFNLSAPPVIITIIISTILTARDFFLSWRQSAVNEEKIKKELAVTKYEALKNQVNPHFLFNSLNVLTSLVYKDADLSAKFIKKLSEVYRYVLEVKDMQLNSLNQEISFLKSYIFLLKMRHQEGLDVQIHVVDNHDIKIVPLSLQMLVENAVKHNVVSGEQPLTIEVFRENGYLVVRNNLQKKPVKNASTPEIGLSNIIARYAFLTDNEVIVNEEPPYFEVKLPVLWIKE
ncbi:MAG: histidine kinase [Saprospiraceae bacterium]|nr:histidine kinase [Saprospiraceae bacterium]